MANAPSETLAARRLYITEGPLVAVLWRLIVPAAIWYLLSYSFFIADAYFVGQLGTDKLAVIGLISAVVMLTLTLAQGLGSALAALTSFLLGADEHALAARLVWHALLLGVAVAAGLFACAAPATHAVFASLGAAPAMQADATAYMSVWYAGFGFTMLGVIAQSALRATGDVVTPALILFGMGVLNVLLDPVLIFGWGPLPALGIQGAALAGVMARACGALVALWLVARRDRLLSVRTLDGLRQSWVQLSKIAVPVALQMIALGLVGALTLRIAGALGPAAVAGLGVGNRVEAVIAALVFGLPVILPTFIGQNAGAGKQTRAGEGALLGARQVALAQLCIAGVLALAAPWLGRPFSDDADVRAAIQTFAWYAPVSYAGYALTGMAAGVFITLGRMGSYLLIAALPTIPMLGLAWLGARSFGLPGLLGGMSVVRLAVGAVAWFWARAILTSSGYLARPERRTPTVAILVDEEK